MEETGNRESEFDSSAVTHVALILSMKLCSQAVQAYLSRMDPDHFHLRNGSCYLDGAQVAENLAHATEFWASLLPVLGGLLSSICLGYISVMQLGGFGFILSSVLMSIAESTDWMCSHPKLSHALWVLPTLSAGIAEPAIVYGAFRWHGQCPRIRTMVIALLLLCNKFGEDLGTLPWPEILGTNHILFAIASSIVYTILSISLQEYSHESPYRIPTFNRIVRYAKIFSSLTLFTAVQADYHWSIYAQELKVLAGIDVKDWSLSLRSPSVFGLAGYFSCVIATVAFSRQFSLPIQIRIYAGIFLGLLSSTFLAIFTATFAASSNPSLLNIWLLVSLCDGVAHCLITVAYFEFTDSITSQEFKPFVIGILLTIWGIGGAFSELSRQLFDNVPIDNPIGKPAACRKPLFFVYHLFSVGLLAGSLLYHRFWSLKWSETLLSEPEDTI